MRPVVLAAALVLAGCTAEAPKTLGCTAERAVYSLRGQPEAQLRLLKPPHPMGAASDLALRVDIGDGTYWFSLTSSNGYSRDYLIPASDPFRDEAAPDEEREPDQAEEDPIEFLGFDAAYNLLKDLPQSGRPAPAHILATGIGVHVWYSEPRRELQRAVWDLTACG